MAGSVEAAERTMQTEGKGLQQGEISVHVWRFGGGGHAKGAGESVLKRGLNNNNLLDFVKQPSYHHLRPVRLSLALTSSEVCSCYCCHLDRCLQPFFPSSHFKHHLLLRLSRFLASAFA